MINFDAINVELPKLDFTRVSEWLISVAAVHGRIVGRLSYLFCDDTEILRVNRQFLNHDYFTDIITFDYSRNKRVGGDMIISLDTVRSNSESLGVTYESELLRVIVHGLLHLCGIDDKAPGEREVMQRHEDEALSLWNDNTPSI